MSVQAKKNNTCLRQLAFIIFTVVCGMFYSNAYALTDGTYVGTTSGAYAGLGCSSSFGTTGFSGATVTLSVQNGGSNITMTIALSGVFSAIGIGSESGGSLNLDFVSGGGNLNIQAKATGDSIGGFVTSGVSISQSGNTITVSGAMLAGDTVNCFPGSFPGVNFDWNSFSVTLSANIVDPAITPGTILTTPEIIDIQITNIKSDFERRVSDVLRGFARGLVRTDSGVMYGYNSGINAGDGASGFGAWVSYSYSDFENDFALTAFDGTRHGVLVGVDFMPWDNTVLGLAGGYEMNDIDTDFNAGEQETEGYTIATYFGTLLTDTWSIDFSLGYSLMETDQFRTAPGSTTRISSSPDADRMFGAANINGLWFFGNWILGARTGALYARNEEDSFVESDGTLISDNTTRLGQWNIGGDVTYRLGNFEPYVRGSYEYDFKQTNIGLIGGTQPSFDDDNYLVGAGIRYFGDNGLSGNIEWYKRLDRDDFEEDSINFTIRGEF